MPIQLCWAQCWNDMIEMNENRQTNETIQTIELGVKKMFQMLTYLSLVWFKMFETLNVENEMIASRI